MLSKKCNDPQCYNHDTSASIFCEDCLEDVIQNMDCDDLYEMFISGQENLNTAMIDGEALGVMTPEGKKALNKCKKQWFNTMNKCMLKNEDGTT